jgi:hypothetical protein
VFKKYPFKTNTYKNAQYLQRSRMPARPLIGTPKRRKINTPLRTRSRATVYLQQRAPLCERARCAADFSAAQRWQRPASPASVSLLTMLLLARLSSTNTAIFS